MAFFMKKKQPQAQQPAAVSGISIQSSALGKARPIGFGKARIAPNLIWYGDFTAIPHTSQTAGGGGKGGVTGGGGGKNGGGGQTTYTYQAAVAFGICEGPILGVDRVWASKKITTLSALGLTLFLGSYPQTAWGYLTSTRGSITESHTIPGAGPFTVQVNEAENPITFGTVVDGALVQVAQGVVGEISGPLSIVVNGGNPIGADSGVVNIGQNMAMGRVDQVLLNQYPGAYSVDLSTGTYTFNVGGPTQVQITYVTVSNTYTKVASAPASFQYAVDESTGIYEFNAAQAGVTVRITYTPGSENQALAYTGLAYVAAGPYQLGDSAQLPQHNFEVRFIYSDSIAGQVDADPSLVLTYLLSDTKNGAVFPLARIGDLTVYQDYTIAAGLWISPVYSEQASAESMISDILKYTNSAAFWSEGLLKITPYGDQALNANGHTYTPPAAPEYDLTDDDFIANDDEDPVRLRRVRPSDKMNAIKIECLNREKEYNTEIVEAKNQAAIDLYGLRGDPAQTAHLFCDADAAQLAAQLLLQREEILNTYEFKVSCRYMRLDPMDIVTLTDSELGLDRQWVRITKISEDDDGDLLMEAEEYLAGTGAAALNTFSTGAGGFTANYNASAGNVNQPVFLEPLAPMTQGALEVWVGVSGGPTFGGADVWVSEDNQNYRYLGRANAPSRQGVLAADLPDVDPATTGPMIDAVNVLAVDLSTSRAQLLPGTQQNALALTTLCYVDGEYVAYQNADLTAPYTYDLSWLVRGIYGSEPVLHSAGAPFVRLDGSLFSIPFTPDRVGSAIYVKFLTVNQYGGGIQSLADVDPYQYVIEGTALAGPLANVLNFRSVYIDDLTQLSWDQISDFRAVEYEIRKGDNFDGAQILGRVQSPPFPAQGNGTYWIVARAQPTPVLVVYSPTPTSLEIEGAALTQNIIASYDQGALGWPGTVDGTAVNTGSYIVTGPVGNILDILDWLAEPDILNYGGFEGSEGTYTIPLAQRIDIGRVAPCLLLINWVSNGQTAGQDILTVPDYLGITDLLDSAASANVDVYPEVATAGADGIFGDWVRYTPGYYNAQHFDARMRLKSLDGQTLAYLLDMVFEVDVPDITYVGTDATILAAGNNITFPAAFNGGPTMVTGVGTPNIQITILNAQAGDDAVLTNQTLTGFTIRIFNGGVGVQRNVNWRADGW